MLARIEDVDFVAKEVLYRGICRTMYHTKEEQLKKKHIPNQPTTGWHLSRSLHEDSFKSLCNLLKEEIIENFVL